MTADLGIKKRREAMAKKGFSEDSENSSRTATPKQLTKKQKLIKYGSIAGGLIFLILIIMAGCAPRKGTMMYGVCLVFTERMLTYPSTLQVNYVEQYPMATRIGFSFIDSFGQFSTKMIECSYRPDKQMGLAIDTVFLNRVEVDSDLVAEFNRGIPAIVKNPPDLTLPPPMPKELVALKK